MKTELLLKKIKHWSVYTLLFLANVALLQAQEDVRLTKVDTVEDEITISNFGTMEANITNYQLCLGPGTYVRVGATTGGNVIIPPSSDVIISYNVNEASGGLSLFSNTNFGSSNPADLIAYVQWGAANQLRVGQAVTAGRWDNASNFVSGTPPYSTTEGGSAAVWFEACDANGGQIQIAATTDTTAEICVGEGIDDLIDVEFVDPNVRSGDSFSWVITDQATGDILGKPASVPAGGFSLEGAPTGICDIWYLRYNGDIGFDTATNVSQLSGCFDLSNPISVTRNAVNGGEIQIAGTTDTTAEICVGEGIDDLIDVEFVDPNVRSGDSFSWVITDQATGDILGKPASVPAGGFSLEGAPTGICDIWYLRYNGDIGFDTATNVSQLSGCFDLSNPISVTRNAVNGGEIQIAGTTDTTAEICVGEGADDLIDVEFTASSTTSGTNGIYVITDQATGQILGTPAAGPFNLEGAPAGICDIWYLRYEDGLTGLTMGQNVAGLAGCFDLSNPISITRLTGTDCSALSVDDFEADFNFSVYPNPVQDELSIKYAGSQNLNLEVQVINMLGKQLINDVDFSNKANTVLDMRGLNSGTYFLNIRDKNSGSSIVKRVVKN
ncbi:T9SS type A sorting domain-containing protein [uncultured Algibacter sp.]|uniref:T9SS type A sorting domain-containing protein n=1 Tax=uncultured Algibacter sp. TaxID=298659 RepID=UPI002603DAA0|nr:T9SS type A sorting domain-containing protein [uncultured Algibacter sp.]